MTEPMPGTDVSVILADIVQRLERIERAIIAGEHELTKPPAVALGYSPTERARADAADREWAEVERATPPQTSPENA